MEKLTTINTDEAVTERYSAASKEREVALCCPVVYDQKFLEVIPKEIIDRDYGCGDPSPYVNEGDTVVDLGSGGGKLCYIISQQVGPKGKVIGVDYNADMLQLARGYQKEVATKIGHDNVEFRCGRIQDLAIDLDQLTKEMSEVVVKTPEDALNVLQLTDTIRKDRPMIPDNSVDCVVSNCVLNLVREEDRKQMFAEIFRVLKPGGKAAISDIVSDEDSPPEMKNNSDLWSGCISGAWREDRFIHEFKAAGFAGMVMDKLQKDPWQTVNGIEFRSATVLAYKPFTEKCYELNQAVIYRGPFEKVYDEEGHVYPRGQRMAVCDRTFKHLQQGPYAGMFIPVEPLKEVSLESAQEYSDCAGSRVRSPKETKGQQYNLTLQSNDSCCGDDSGCC